MSKENLKPEDDVLELDDADIIEEGNNSEKMQIKTNAEARSENITANNIALVIHDSIALIGSKGPLKNDQIKYTIERIKNEVLSNSSRFEFEKSWPQVEAQIKKFQQIELMQAQGILRQLESELKIVKAVDVAPAPKPFRPNETGDIKDISIEQASLAKDEAIRVANIRKEIEPENIEKLKVKAKAKNYNNIDSIKEDLLIDRRSELLIMSGHLSGATEKEWSGHFSDQGSEIFDHTISPESQVVITEIENLIAEINKQLGIEIKKGGN